MFSGCSAFGCDCNNDSHLKYFAIRSGDVPFVGCLCTDSSLLVCGNVKNDYSDDKQNYTGINCSANNRRTYCGCDNETTIDDGNINAFVCGSITRKAQLGFSYDYDEIESYAIGCSDGCLYLSIAGDEKFGYIIPEAYANDIAHKELNMALGRMDCMGNEL